jgi:hypothetical protein
MLKIIIMIVMNLGIPKLYLKLISFKYNLISFKLYLKLIKLSIIVFIPCF